MAALQQRLVGDESAEKYRRAVTSMSVAFLLIFTGYNAAQGLQSSLNGTLGYVNLAALYFTFALGCIVTPALLQRHQARGRPIRVLMPPAAFIYAILVLVNMHPVPRAGDPGYELAAAVDIFCSFLVGLAAPVLWTVQNVYLGRCALHAAHLSEDQDGDVVSRTTSAFNSLFFTYYQFAGALGTGMSSAVLLLDRGGSSRTALFVVLGIITLAGALWTLVAIPTVPPPPGSTPLLQERAGDHCTQTLKLIAKEPRMSLMVPLIFTNGCFLGFVFSDYPKAFVSATIGPGFAGIALMTFYGCNAVASAAYGWLILHGRIRVWGLMVIAFALQLFVLLLLLASSAEWLPLFRQHYTFVPGAADVQQSWVLIDGSELPAWWEHLAPLGCAAVAAFGDAAYESQPPAVLQSYFRDVRVIPAMANYKLWQSLGFAVSFFVGAVVPSIVVRIVALVALFVASFVALAVLHYRVATISGQL